MPRPFSLDFEYLTPAHAFVLYALLAAPVLLLALRSHTFTDPARKWVSLGLRLDLLLFLTLLIAGARLNRAITDVTVIAVHDTSRSTAAVPAPPGYPSVHAAIDAYLRAQSARKSPTDRFGQITFAAEPRIDLFPTALDIHPTPAIPPDPSQTDPAAALHLALATAPADTLSRLVLFWDGNATTPTADLDAVVNQAAARHIPIDVVPLDYRITREISADHLIAPASRTDRQPVPLQLIVHSRDPAPVRATLTLTDNGLPLDLDPKTPGLQPTLDLTLPAGPSSHPFTLPPLPSGAHRFHAHLDPLDSTTDTLLPNNGADAITLVRGRSRTLYLTNPADPPNTPRPVATALKQANLLDDADLLPATAFDFSATALQPYDAVILDNVPKGPAGLSNDADHLLAQYVHELGGGLLMIGGPDSFGAGGWIGSELEKILPVDCLPPARQAVPPGALVLVIDRSGSMAGGIDGTVGTKQQAAAESAVLALQTLLPQDQVGVLAFDNDPTWIVPLAPNADPAATERALRNITPGGETAIHPALRAARDALAALPRNTAAVKHILLLTDGQSTPADYAPLLSQLRADHITLSTVAIGSDADTKLLASLAQAARGRFYPVLTATTLPQIFIKEAVTLRTGLLREHPYTPHIADPNDPVLPDATAFSTFTGLVATWPKPSPQVHLTLTDDTALPLLARWPTGLGQAAAFTADAGPRWTADFANTPAHTRFFAALLHAIARPTNSITNADLHVTPLSPTQARLTIELPDDRSATPTTATLLTPDPHAPPLPLTLTQVAPHTYQSDFPTPIPGPYLALAQLRTASSLTSDLGSMTLRPLPPSSPPQSSVLSTQSSPPSLLPAPYLADPNAELRDLQSNPAALADVAARTNGRLLALNSLAPLFSRANLPARSTSLPLTNALLILSMIALLLDVAARRIAWDRHTVHHLATAFTAKLHPAPARPAADARVTLRALKSVRRSTAQDQLDRNPAILPPRPASPQTPTPPTTPTIPAPTFSRLADAKRRANSPRR